MGRIEAMYDLLKRFGCPRHVSAPVKFVSLTKRPDKPTRTGNMLVCYPIIYLEGTLNYGRSVFICV